MPEAGSLPIPHARVFPIGTVLNEAGRIAIGGCDTIELAREFGTPAYVYAEEDIRARARAYMDAFRARTENFEVLYASKAFPCTAAERILVEEGLSCDVASGGELHIALAAGFDPARIYMHGNNKTEAELAYAIEQGIGHIVVDSFDEIDRLERLAAGKGQRVLIRVTPGSSRRPTPTSRRARSTRSSASTSTRSTARWRAAPRRGWRSAACMRTSARRSSSAASSRSSARSWPAWATTRS